MAIPLTFLGPLPVASAAPTPGPATVLSSATLAPISLGQVGPAMVRPPADDPESAARLGAVTPEVASPAIDPASMVTLLAASAQTPQVAGAAGPEKPAGAQIIAFVCRKLPTSPNPDPKLDWPSKPSKPHGGKRDGG